MPYAVTHVLLTIILVDLFRDYFMEKTHHKRYLTLYTLVIAGIGGLLPDIDMPITWLLNILGYSFDILRHGGITHTLFFGLLFLIPGFILWKKKQHKKAVYFFVITFGIFFHIFLDYLLGGGHHYGVMWLWPLTTTRFKLHLLVETPKAFMAIDALILILWLWHEEVKHKIKDFI